MAAPASSAPPKKIVAPTVSQINAEYVTQVRPGGGAGPGEVSGPGKAPRCLNGLCGPWVLGKGSCFVVSEEGFNVRVTRERVRAPSLSRL